MAASEPPGSLGLPFVGETLAFLGDPFGFTRARTMRHGPVWRTRILGDTVVFLAGPEAYAFFMQPGNFSRGRGTPAPIRALLHPEAVPYLDGDALVVRKQLLAAAFTPAELDGHLPGIVAILDRYGAAWVEAGPHALADELGQLAFDVADHLFLASDPATSDTRRAGDLAALNDGMLALPLNLPFTAYGRAVRARDRIRAHIADRLADDQDGSMAGALRAAQGPHGERLTDDELAIELLHFFFAAHGGLTGALAWSLVELGAEPALVDRLRQEADRVLGDGPPTTASVQQLPVARAVARELLRAHPIVATSQFGVAERDLEFAGHRIPAGTKAAGAIWATLQDDATFPEPSVFRADRLCDHAFAALPDDAYVPQGGGPPLGHRCSGEPLVQLVLPLFLAWFAQRHDWSFPHQDVTPSGAALAPLPTDGVRGTVTRRVHDAGPPSEPGEPASG